MACNFTNGRIFGSGSTWSQHDTLETISILSLIAPSDERESTLPCKRVYVHVQACMQQKKDAQ